MTSIDISLSESPFKRCFAFAPGEKMHINVSFGEETPERYRLQILDQRNNARLNRYGKGSKKGIILDWPIPRTIRKEHLGIWHIQLEDNRNNQVIYRSFFFVENQQRIEMPLLSSGPIILGLTEQGIASFVVPEHIPILEEDKISIISDNELVDERNTLIDANFEHTPEKLVSDQISPSKIPITIIKGLGKIYAERLKKIKIYSVKQFFYYPDRIGLAKLLRVSDTKLEKMLTDANRILKEEELGVKIISDKIVESTPTTNNSLASISGIGPKSVEKLTRLGITSKDEFLNYNDLETLRKTLHISFARLQKLFTSIGKEIVIEENAKKLPMDLLNQSVIILKGIGSKNANKLNSKGIKTIKNLIDSSYDQVKDIINESAYLKWKNNAKLNSVRKFCLHEEKIPPLELLSDNGKELAKVPGIGPKSMKKLTELGITTLDELLKYDDLETLRKTLRMSIKRIKELLNSLNP